MTMSPKDNAGSLSRSIASQGNLGGRCDTDVAARSTPPGSLNAARRRPHERRWWKRWFFIFEPRDLWIGVFVSPEKFDEASGDFVQRTYFALIPTIVLVRQSWYPGGLIVGKEDRGSYADA